MKKGLYLTVKLKVLLYCFFVLFIALIFAVSYSAGVTVLSQSVSSPVIIIDAGHGGEDGGTQTVDGTLEKDINLKISQKLEKILNDNGYKTVMVRDSDKLIYDDNCTTVRTKKSSDIHNRLAIMSKYTDCIFVSIHQNYFTQSKYSGAQVFYRPEHEQSRMLAEIIQKSIVSTIQNDNTRQIKACTSDVYLIHNAVSTAVMVECGFLSNPDEAERLKNDAYQQKMAQAIAQGLKNYLNTKETDNYGK